MPRSTRQPSRSRSRIRTPSSEAAILSRSSCDWLSLAPRSR
jgi:hypothetical protein